MLESSDSSKDKFIRDSFAPKNVRSYSEQGPGRQTRVDSLQSPSQRRMTARRSTSAARLQNFKMTLKISQKDHKLLNEMITDNSDDTIRRKLVAKYNNYYRLWQDFNILVAFFALISLALAVAEWETQFEARGPRGDIIQKADYFTDLIVLVISIMGSIAIIAKFYFEAIWRQYKNPVAFYKSMIQRQVEIGMISEESLTENFQNQSPVSWMLKQSSFWLELVLMLVVHLPYDRIGNGQSHIIYMKTINWIDNGGVNAAQSVEYDTPYLLEDFFLAFMFLRLYFFTLAMIMFSPVNDRLHGKRVCQNSGFEPRFSFQIRAGMRSLPITTFFVMSGVLIFGLSYAVRIFERPYFCFVFQDQNEQSFYNFQTLSSTLWYTIITMTSVGYGGIIATTPLGRFTTILITIVGAFLLSLLVAIITEWFNMEERQTDAIHQMQRDKHAAQAVRTAFRYAVARNKRYRLLDNGNEEKEHIPTLEELCLLKTRMYVASERFKKTISDDKQDSVEDKRDKTIELLKQQVLDLNDKFDYFVCMMLKTQGVPLHPISGGAAEQGLGEKDRKDLLERFGNFRENALAADLGNRQALRVADKAKRKRLGANWLESLETLVEEEEQEEERQSVLRSTNLEKSQKVPQQQVIVEEMHESESNGSTMRHVKSDYKSLASSINRNESFA